MSMKHIIVGLHCDKTIAHAKMPFNMEGLEMILNNVRLYVLFILVNVGFITTSMNILTTLMMKWFLQIHGLIPLIVFLYISLLIERIIKENICSTISNAILLLTSIDVLIYIIYSFLNIHQFWKTIKIIPSDYSFITLIIGIIGIYLFVIYFIIYIYFPYVINKWINKNCFKEKIVNKKS